jgi:hypothetical protein
MQFEAAVAAAPYLHPRLAATTVKANVTGEIACMTADQRRAEIEALLRKRAQVKGPMMEGQPTDRTEYTGGSRRRNPQPEQAGLCYGGHRPRPDREGGGFAATLQAGIAAAADRGRADAVRRAAPT